MGRRGRTARRTTWAARTAAFGTVVAAFVVASALVGGAAQTYTMVVVPDQVLPGELFTISNADGSECAPNQQVSGSVDGLPVSGWTTTADANGDWTKQLYIYENIGYDVFGNPIPTPPGEYTINASCTDAASSGVGSTATIVYQPAVITVLAPPTPPVTPEDPAAEAVELEPAFTG